MLNNNLINIIQLLKTNYPELFNALRDGYSARELYAEDAFQVRTGRLVRQAGIKHLETGNGEIAQGFRANYDPILAAVEVSPEKEALNGNGIETGLTIQQYLKIYSEGYTRNEDLMCHALCECFGISIYLIQTTEITRNTTREEHFYHRVPNSHLQINLHLHSSLTGGGHYYLTEPNDTAGNGNCFCNAIAKSLYIQLRPAILAFEQQEATAADEKLACALQAQDLIEKQKQEQEKSTQEKEDAKLAKNIDSILKMQEKALKGGLLSTLFKSSNQNASTSVSCSSTDLSASKQPTRQELDDAAIATSLAAAEYAECEQSSAVSKFIKKLF